MCEEKPEVHNKTLNGFLMKNLDGGNTLANLATSSSSVQLVSTRANGESRFSVWVIFKHCSLRQLLASLGTQE